MGASPPGSRREMAAVLLVDLHGGAQPHHVVDGGFHQPDGAGDGGADDVLALFAVAAVALCIKSDDAVFLGVESNGRHAVT